MGRTPWHPARGGRTLHPRQPTGRPSHRGKRQEWGKYNRRGKQDSSVFFHLSFYPTLASPLFLCARNLFPLLVVFPAGKIKGCETCHWGQQQGRRELTLCWTIRGDGAVNHNPSQGLTWNPSQTTPTVLGLINHDDPEQCFFFYYCCTANKKRKKKKH